MFLREKPFMTGLYWQAVKEYKWRVSRLSILLTVLTFLIVGTLNTSYLGTARVTFSSLDMTSVSAAYFPFTDRVEHKELGRIYEKLLLENIAKGVLKKLEKFKLVDLDSELEAAITNYVTIAQLKQKVRTVFPFMPQQDPDPLSSKQLGMLKNNYSLEQIVQNLQLRYVMSRFEVYIAYTDSRSTFAVIIAKLAADSYMQSVAETKKQMSAQIQHGSLASSIALTSQELETLNQNASFTVAQTREMNIQIGNYTTTLLKPNRVLIVSLSLCISMAAILSLVWVLVRLKIPGRQKNAVVTTPHKL